MAEIKLNKRYKYAGDIVKALLNRLQWTLEDVTEFMNSIEDADVVEVVRCENCQFVHINKDSCTYHCKRRGFFSEEVMPTDFCSYGERKNENSN